MPRSRTSGIACERKKLVTVRDGWEYKVVRIRSKGNKPLWTLFKKFVNTLDSNEEFTRKQLLLAIYEKKSAQAIRGLETSIDHYRLYCCHIGFVEHVGLGRYKKLHPIPNDMTVTVAQQFAYNTRLWQEWFIPKAKKLEMIYEKYGGGGAMGAQEVVALL